MDPTPSAPLPPRVGRGWAAKSEGSVPPSDPVERPPSPGLGSLYSRQSHLSLAAFERTQAARRRRILTCAGVTAALLLLAGLLAFFLFPRPPSVSTAAPTFALNGLPTPASFSATFTVAVDVDNSASYVPWGLKDISIAAFSPYSNAPFVTAQSGKPLAMPARALKSFLFSLGVSTASSGVNQIALLSCAQAVLAGTGCSTRIRVTGTPTYLGLSLAPRTFDASVVIAL
jgi:hypothetical protein